MYGLPRARMYWAISTRIEKIANVLSQYRWEERKPHIHCNDNTNFNQNDPNRDRLFKERPLIDSLQEKFRGIPKDQYAIVLTSKSCYLQRKLLIKTVQPKKAKSGGTKYLYRVILQV